MIHTLRFIAFSALLLMVSCSMDNSPKEQKTTDGDDKTLQSQDSLRMQRALEKTLGSGAENTQIEGQANHNSIYEAIAAGQHGELTLDRLSNVELDTVCFENMFDCFPCSASTPLQQAVYNTDHKLLRLLLEAGADPNFSGLDKTTALHYAANLNDTISARLLIQYGAVIDSRDYFEMTPFLTAAEWSQPEVMEFLLRQGADWKAKNVLGKNALQVSRDCCGDGMGESIDPKDEVQVHKRLIEMGLK